VGGTLEKKHKSTGTKKDATPDDQKVRLLEEQLQARAEELQQARRQSLRNQDALKELDDELKRLKEKHQADKEAVSNQAEMGNAQFEKLEELEKEIRTFEEESELLALGLHAAESGKEFLEEELALMQAQVEGRYRGNLQQWAEEVQRIRVAAQVQAYQDELTHWKQAVEESDASIRQNDPSLHPDEAAHLQQKRRMLEEQLAAREKQLRELEQSMQEDQPGNVQQRIKQDCLV